ncbi:T9SS type A sorting domain-containing protein [Chryseobacterium gossypii]|uniref:T9SS type A sorting domain-containing protein n=1 Tax=Chryseobacterium gossypii TaxID=3231602 RepID=UPI003523ECE8
MVPGFQPAINANMIDFNNDGIAEYNFRSDDFGSSWFMHMVYGPGGSGGSPANQIALKNPSTISFAQVVKPLQLNDLIDGDLTWGTSLPEPFIGVTNTPTNTDINFLGLGDRYIGVKFPLNGNIHYGWILVNFEDSLPYRRLVIKSYAYNTIPNASILAGQTNTLGVDTISSNRAESFIYPNPAKYEIIVPEHTSEITVLDITGKAVLQKKVPSDRKVNVRRLEKGSYLVRLTDKNGNTTYSKMIKSDTE